MKITDLEKKIGNFCLQIDHLDIEPGRIHGIIGPNGCGKTVLLKILAGIYTPDRGTIDYEGISPREITMLSQRPYLMDASVYKNLVYPLQVTAYPAGGGIRRMRSLRKAGLLGQKRQYARSLSSGERQKLSFLRAVIFQPKLVMIDETFSNLDTESETLFIEMIREIQKKEPITWIIVSHQLEAVHQLCETIHYMEKGSVIKNETIAGRYRGSGQREIEKGHTGA